MIREKFKRIGQELVLQKVTFTVFKKEESKAIPQYKSKKESDFCLF